MKTWMLTTKDNNACYDEPEVSIYKTEELAAKAACHAIVSCIEQSFDMDQSDDRQLGQHINDLIRNGEWKQAVKAFTQDGGTDTEIEILSVEPETEVEAPSPLDDDFFAEPKCPECNKPESDCECCSYCCAPCETCEGCDNCPQNCECCSECAEPNCEGPCSDCDTCGCSGDCTCYECGDLIECCSCEEEEEFDEEDDDDDEEVAAPVHHLDPICSQCGKRH
jgi:hypothetical protein